MADGRSSRRERGQRGEGAAADFLEKLGYKIQARNFRTRYGEIDLIASDGDTLIFVEVRSRYTANLGPPEESISYKKRARLRQLALLYLSAYPGSWKGLRFDVVTVNYTGRMEQPLIKLYQNAF